MHGDAHACVGIFCSSARFSMTRLPSGQLANRDNNAIAPTRQLYWQAYTLEKILSFELGRPSCTDNEVQNFPHFHPLDENGWPIYLPWPLELSLSDWPFPLFFVSFVNFCDVQSKIYGALFAPSGRKRMVSESGQMAEALHADLTRWTKQFPPNIR